MNIKVKIALWLLFFAGIITTTAFVENSSNDMLCRKINIRIDKAPGNNFLDKKDVMNVLLSNGDSLVDKKVSLINTGEIEKLIKKLEPVDSVQAFVSVDGEVFINISLRKVLLRVIPHNGKGFYIDSAGARMEWLPKYTSRVVVATGDYFSYCGVKDSSLAGQCEKKVVKDLYVIAKFFSENEYWEAFTDQLYFNERGEIELVPKYGSFRVILGGVDNLEEKFNKLDLFYKNSLRPENIDAYSEIILKYRDQIVCKKKVI
ncbi:MAG: cell division protein FtsQ/DivIB [Flavobacteriales bacterium]